MDELKLIKCSFCGVKHQFATLHKCDVKVRQGYLNGVESTYEKVKESLKNMEDIYKAATEGREAYDEDFTRGVISAMFCIRKMVDDLENTEAYAKLWEEKK